MKKLVPCFSTLVISAVQSLKREIGEKYWLECLDVSISGAFELSLYLEVMIYDHFCVVSLTL